MSNTSVVQATAVNVPTTTETAVVATTLNTVANPAGQGVCIAGVLNILAGTGTTAVVVRVRAGNGTTGTLIGVAMTHTLAAAASASIPFEVLDSSAGALSGSVQYTVTVQQTGASGAGTVNIATVEITPATASS